MGRNCWEIPRYEIRKITANKEEAFTLPTTPLVYKNESGNKNETKNEEP